jgi:hypothetical protein
MSAPSRPGDAVRPTDRLLGGKLHGRPPAERSPARDCKRYRHRRVTPRGRPGPIRCDVTVGRRVTDCPQHPRLTGCLTGAASALVAAEWGPVPRLHIQVCGSPTPAPYRRSARPTAAACGGAPPGTQALRPCPQPRSDRQSHRAPSLQLLQLARSGHRGDGMGRSAMFEPIFSPASLER